jgi:hypothetical protein
MDDIWKQSSGGKCEISGVDGMQRADSKESDRTESGKGEPFLKVK